MKYKGVEELYFPNYTYDKEVFLSNLNRLNDIEKEDLKNFLSFLRRQNNKQFNESESGVSLIKLHKLEKFLQNLFQEDITFSTKRAGLTGTEKGFQSFIPSNVLEELYALVLEENKNKAVIEIKHTYENKKQIKYLELVGDDFIYNGVKMEIATSTRTYKMLRAVYEYFNGESGEILYKDLSKIMCKIKGLKNESNSSIKKLFRESITSNTSTLFSKIKPFETNGKKLFETIRGIGIRFNNN